MRLFERIHNLWRLSELRDLHPAESLEYGDVVSPLVKKNGRQKAEFLTSTRVDEIMKGKKDVKIDDILS